MNEPLGEREVLCVSQFTLYGDTRKGNRPELHRRRRRPEQRRAALRALLRAARRRSAGVFGARMEVELVNDGPVTLLLEV